MRFFRHKLRVKYSCGGQIHLWFIMCFRILCKQQKNQMNRTAKTKEFYMFTLLESKS